MGSANAALYAVNGGEVGAEGLARLDLERMQFSGSLYSNMLPRVVGSMTFRPGLEHIIDLPLGDVRLLEYSYSGKSSLVPILANENMYVVKDRAFVSRVAVSTTVGNGDFSSFSGWTNASGSSASASVSGGELLLLGTTQDTAIAKRAVSVASGDRGVEHAIRIVITRGPVSMRLGSTDGAADLINAVELEDGTHSISFTPTTANIYLALSNKRARRSRVDSCQIEGAGVMALPTPWGSSDLLEGSVRYTQHKDVLYVASGTNQPREIQRRGDASWGVQRYKINDGPFVTSDRDVSLMPSGYTDDGTRTLTSSRAYFEPTMVGRLFRIFQSGQTVTEVFTSAPSEGAYVRISGVGNSRAFNYSITGTWAGTVRLQIATDDGSGNPGSWVTYKSFSTNTSGSHTDTDDNVIKYARFVVETGGLTSGSISTTIGYAGGSNFGICRMTGYTNATIASIEILNRFYSTKASFEWDYSVWSDYDGWPAAVEKFGGRLYWGLGDFVYGSIPDNYKSFDDDVEGDSAPIARSIGSNTDRGSLWMLGLLRLIVGTDSGEVSVKASSFDEPLTSSQWFPLESSNRGCANIRALRCDSDGIFVQSSGTSVFAIVPSENSSDYVSRDLTELHEEICDGSPIVDLAVQRKPDTVLWFILANGQARALTYEPAERVVAWSRVVTDGQIKRVCANRGAGEDNVYFAVVRNGTQRLEKLSKLSECRGGKLNCLADGFTRFVTEAGQTTFSVPHLNGLQVTVWVDGKALHDQSNLYTVTDNNVVIAAQLAGKHVVIGLPYIGDFKSTKLAYAAQNGSALFKQKKVPEVGLYLVNTSPSELYVGKDFSALTPFSTTYDGRKLEAGEVVPEYDSDMSSVSNDWNTDSRICIRASSPYPATVAAIVLNVKTSG